MIRVIIILLALSLISCVNFIKIDQSSFTELCKTSENPEELSAKVLAKSFGRIQQTTSKSFINRYKFKALYHSYFYDWGEINMIEAKHLKKNIIERMLFEKGKWPNDVSKFQRIEKEKIIQVLGQPVKQNAQSVSYFCNQDTNYYAHFYFQNNRVFKLILDSPID